MQCSVYYKYRMFSMSWFFNALQKFDLKGIEDLLWM